LSKLAPIALEAGKRGELRAGEGKILVEGSQTGREEPSKGGKKGQARFLTTCIMKISPDNGREGGVGSFRKKT